MEKTSFYSFNTQQLAQFLNLEKKYQAKQIQGWLNKGVYEFDKMSNLSAAFRKTLIEKYQDAMSSEVIDSQVDESGATKLAIRFADNSVVECVLLVSKSGTRTACLSSQIGCAMGCKFCRTGTMKLIRNLHYYEIIEQFIHLMRLKGSITSIVFMGMGEPMANLDEVLKAIEFFHNPEGIGLSHRKMTISTCGVVPGIKKLTFADIPIKLALSLTVADDKKREQVMPITRSFPLSMVKRALLDYQHHYKRRITFECCLIKGFNTSEIDAKHLASFANGLDVVVNLIPFNEAAELNFKTPSEEELDKFTDELDRLGVSYTRRFSRGRNVNGACGQLAVKYEFEDED